VVLGAELMDWTAAMDDLLTERWKRHCSLCGLPGVHVGIWQVEALFVSFVFCRTHADQMASSEAALDRLLRQRYSAQVLQEGQSS
jgi:hypothetical protein